VILRPSAEIDGYFLCCLFNSIWGQGKVAGSLVGVAQQHFNIGVAKEMEVNLPPLSIQKQITRILCAYDELVENSTRRIKILGEMARMIYREWFVKFRLPGNEKVTMVESEIGPIPDGWKTARLGDIVEEIIDYRGKTPKKLGGEWAEHGVLALSALNVKQGRLENLDKAKFVSEELYGKWMKSELRAGDILMTSEAPLGEAYFLPETRRYCLSQRVFSLRADPARIKPAVLYLFLSSPNGQNQVRAKASGTTVLGIRQSDLRQLLVMQPDLATQERAEAILLPFLREIDVLHQQAANIRQTSDLLLPRLMSGEIDVEHLETEAAAQGV
jgi:type I restriction enzyme S subunit